MTLKYIGKKIWDIALKLSEFSCSCGWECGECKGCGRYTDTSTIEPGTENEGHEEAQRAGPAQREVRSLSKPDAGH